MAFSLLKTSLAQKPLPECSLACQRVLKKKKPKVPFMEIQEQGTIIQAYVYCYLRTVTPSFENSSTKPQWLMSYLTQVLYQGGNMRVPIYGSVRNRSVQPTRVRKLHLKYSRHLAISNDELASRSSSMVAALLGTPLIWTLTILKSQVFAWWWNESRSQNTYFTVDSFPSKY